MPKEKLLDLDALRAKERDGLQFEGTRYEWAMVGPIEKAKFDAMQQEIRDALGSEEGVTVEVAEKTVAIQREILKLILPTLTDEVSSHITDEEVGDIISFFELVRTNRVVDTMEDQMEPTERANGYMERAEKIGDRMSQRSKDSTKGTRRPG